MAKAKRVFELARELGVRSKDVLEKCRAEGIEVKNHMASLSAGLEETIREWFSEPDDSAAHTAVETTEHVNIEEARQRAQKARRRRKTREAEEEPTPETSAEEPAETTETEEPATAVAEAPAESEVEAAEEQAQAAAEALVEEAEEDLDAKIAPQAESQAPSAEAEETAPPAEAETSEPQDQEAPEEPEEPASEEDEDVKPAGPQVVPKPAQLKGPRVVRMERPEYTPKPQPRQQPAPMPPQAGRGGNLKEERKRVEDDDKPRRRRSPRRKTGRSADSGGDRIKEWRNQDLVERTARIHGAGQTIRRRRAGGGGGGKGSRKQPGSGIKAGEVEIEEPITVKTLSAATGIKAADIIRKLMGEGKMVTINQVIDTELAETAVSDYDIELKIARATTAEEELMEKLAERQRGEMDTRAPVVTFLGHVDHGKTSLLDYIRHTSVASGEAGGITQAIGAYRHDVGDQHVAFLDTPGHEAFTAMRARGANMTDVVVLVVAADDGVMPQTVEAINHAKAANVPIVVALNKIDVPNANVQRALGQLAEHGLQPNEWGGDTEVIKTSAETGEGIDNLLELLTLEAEMLELQAETDAPASGFVIEARMDPGQGVLATLLIRNGTLTVGDVLLAGGGHGRVRQIYNDRGEAIEQAGPSTPVAITGMDAVPEAGDKFFVVKDLDQARQVAEQRQSEDRAKALASAAQAPRTLEEMLGRLREGETNELPVVLKADVQGSLEALVGSLEKVGSSETRLSILHTGVGGITTGDVTLADASGAVIIGFNVVADAQARRMAEEKHIDIRTYRVIYDITEDMRRALEEGLTPEVREQQLGQADVRATFKISRLGTIAGCYVTEGVVQRNAKVRVVRDSVVIEDERQLESLKREKDDAREVKAGLECGIKIAGYDDIKEGDTLQFYTEIEVARTLG